MGVYFNPKNGSFTGDKNSRIYVDKTGLLEYLNGLLGTNGIIVLAVIRQIFLMTQQLRIVHTIGNT